MPGLRAVTRPARRAAAALRRRVALAPQFHENHVLMGTLAFNLLMGRGWPPRPADMEEAERVCRALDLGPLLDRMPAGILQLVGETGWQLSHGERSRLYLGRALLQGAELIVLDESFAALDPQTLRDALAYVLEQAPTVLVVARSLRPPRRCGPAPPGEDRPASSRRRGSPVHTRRPPADSG